MAGGVERSPMSLAWGGNEYFGVMKFMNGVWHLGVRVEG